MKNIHLIMMTTLIVAVVACEKKENKKSEIHTENYSYQFKYNQCDTEKHEFTSMNELCVALQDEELNQGCAQNLRANHFKENCPGTFTPVNNSNNSKITDDEKPMEPDVVEPNIVKMVADELKTIQFLNPVGEESQTTIYCLSDGDTAQNLLAQEGTGGLILSSGGSAILKISSQDKSIKTLTMISCGKE